MATQWFMQGPWFKNCNCDPGCPCDFNQFPTHDHCEGMLGMRIDRGNFGDVNLSGLHFAFIVRWPGAMHEGNGEVQPIIDIKATQPQQAALLEALSGKHGDTLMEIVAAVCPKLHPPIFAPFEFVLDLDARKGHLKAGTALYTEVEHADDVRRQATAVPHRGHDSQWLRVHRRHAWCRDRAGIAPQVIGTDCTRSEELPRECDPGEAW